MQYLIDAWSFGHLALWAGIGFALIRWLGLPALGAFAVGMLLGVWWEVMELGWVEPLLGFREPWWNRWISDPIFDFAGTAVGVAVAEAKRK